MATLSLASAGIVAAAPAAATHAGRATAASSAVSGFRSEFFSTAAVRSESVKPAVSTKRASSVSVSPVCKVAVGDAAPNFSLLDQNGRPFSLSKLKGKPAVVYFYPADDTPGCTKQACSFRDSFEDFKAAGAVVVGISGDSPESHKAFKEKYDLPFTLLSDEGNEVRKEWGVPSDLFGILPGRQTYVIDKKGVVQLIFNNQFQPEKHINETLSLLESLSAQEPKFQFPKLF